MRCLCISNIVSFSLSTQPTINHLPLAQISFPHTFDISVSLFSSLCTVSHSYKNAPGKNLTTKTWEERKSLSGETCVLDLSGLSSFLHTLLLYQTRMLFRSLHAVWFFSLHLLAIFTLFSFLFFDYSILLCTHIYKCVTKEKRIEERHTHMQVCSERRRTMQEEEKIYMLTTKNKDRKATKFKQRAQACSTSFACQYRSESIRVYAQAHIANTQAHIYNTAKGKQFLGCLQPSQVELRIGRRK